MKKKSCWQPHIYEEIGTGGVADMSFLNHKPAGKYGRLRSKEGKLIFSNGKPARFFALSTVYAINFPETMKQARRHAQWLASIGINLVRIHHIAHSGNSGSILDFWEGKD